VWEPELDADLEGRIVSLLRRSFPGYPERAYFKLPPAFRYVATVDGVLVAQMGVELRPVRAGEAVVRTLGVVDLCVDEGARSRGLASRLLQEVTAAAEAGAFDFVLLFADDERVYLRNGWTRVDNRCTWLKIDEHRTLGLAVRESLADALMVKATGGLAWPEGDVDLLGHVF
jgi:GNAT superfamily N-acetyltransferase